MDTQTKPNEVPVEITDTLKENSNNAYKEINELLTSENLKLTFKRVDRYVQDSSRVKLDESNANFVIVSTNNVVLTDEKNQEVSIKISDILTKYNSILAGYVITNSDEVGYMAIPNEEQIKEIKEFNNKDTYTDEGGRIIDVEATTHEETNETSEVTNENNENGESSIDAELVTE